jgi:hypothetical protein
MAESVAPKLCPGSVRRSLRLTLPKGVGPFVEKLTALGIILTVEGAQSGTAGFEIASHRRADRSKLSAGCLDDDAPDCRNPLFRNAK